MLISNEHTSLTFTKHVLSRDLLRDRLLPLFFAIMVHGSLLGSFVWLSKGQNDGFIAPQEMQETVFFVEVVEEKKDFYVAQEIDEKEYWSEPEPILKPVMQRIVETAAEIMPVLKPRLDLDKPPQKKPFVQPRNVVKASQKTIPQPHMNVKSHLGVKQAQYRAPLYPAYLQNPSPVYPRSARRKRQEGVVLLLVHVDEKGLPVAVKLKKTSGYGVLDESAVQTVRTWRFVAAQISGRAVPSDVVVPIRFHLLMK